MNRRGLLARLLFYGGGCAGLAYGGGIERRRLSVTKTEIPLSPQHAAFDGLKVAAMSDFHHDDFGDSALVRRAVERANAEGVDVVLLAGDFVSRDARAVDSLCVELAALRPRLGTFAVLGNHDRRERAPYISSALAEAGVRVLIDDAVSLPDFAVAGLDSYRGGRPPLARALDGVAPDKPVLLGWHEPDGFDLIDDARVALQISGHTHGGQICAPLLGPVLLPKHGKKYPHGLFRNGSSSLFVTRGIGTLTLPFRFLCPPELALLTMKLAAS